MTKHYTHNGQPIDMGAIMRENEDAVALGNMRVNAKGDQLGKNRQVTKTAEQMARENHRVTAAVVHTGLKGQIPEVAEIPVPTKTKKTREVVKPNGDIEIEGSNE